MYLITATLFSHDQRDIHPEAWHCHLHWAGSNWPKLETARLTQAAFRLFDLYLESSQFAGLQFWCININNRARCQLLSGLINNVDSCIGPSGSHRRLYLSLCIRKAPLFWLVLFPHSFFVLPTTHQSKCCVAWAVAEPTANGSITRTGVPSEFRHGRMVR